jgi:hypothetical protein
MLAHDRGLAIAPEERHRFVSLLSSAADHVGLPDDPEFSSLVAYAEWGYRLAMHTPSRMPRSPSMHLSHDRGVDLRQRQLGPQHHPRRSASGDHHRMLGHSHAPSGFVANTTRMSLLPFPWFCLRRAIMRHDPGLVSRPLSGVFFPLSSGGLATFWRSGGVPAYRDSVAIRRISHELA